MTEIILSGQVCGGKNNILVLRNGMRVPNPKFKRWVANAVAQVMAQCPPKFDVPLRVDIKYIAGDKRRRDIPAILDALWHALERAQVVTDDVLLEDCSFTKSYDKENPGVILQLQEKREKIK